MEMVEGNVKEEMEKMIGEIKQVLEGIDEKEVNERGDKSRWDRECEHKKKEVEKE